MDTEEQKEQAPLFKKWTAWYILVIGFLLLLILFFYFLTKHYS
jgi:Mg2+ and Co2+ transporter CorA